MKSIMLVISSLMSIGILAQLPGEVVDTVVCNNDKSQSYALYLPSNYTTEKKWPIVYFFEPAARGSLPVRLYSEVAEELGYILACTYNSRNGSYDNSFKAADALFLDTEQKLSIDYYKIILSGFSGGSRLALSIAVISNAASGVIGVGAAQPAVPAYMVLEKKEFKYAGLVGARDMNYVEHKTFRSQMNAMQMDNLLLISNFGHKWADPKDFRAALLWMQGDSLQFQEAIKDKIISQGDSIPLSDVIDLNNLIKGENFVSTNAKTSKKTLKEEQKLIRKELLLKKIISDSINYAFDLSSLNNPSIRWVSRRAEKLKNQRDKSDNIPEKMMIDRLLNFISAACYETALQMKSQGFTKKALVGITIWETVTGFEIYGHWLKARIYAVEKDTDQALNHLKIALASGKIKKTSVFLEPDFEGLHDDPRFKQLIENSFD
ncbi:TPR end-of-group domain-containing protein [Ekhidna sp.]|uniref:TPR end-of-group domain-containing protein n=1 Tax=Ekhidna sp. TaxID=2608089 RepID=UPI003BAC1473